MTKEELEHEATEYALEWGNKTDGTYACCRDGYLAAATQREKRIAELEKENEELKKENVALKETLEFQQSCTMDRYFKLKKAKEVIRNLLYVYQLGKNELATARVRAEAEEFLKEVGQ